MSQTESIYGSNEYIERVVGQRIKEYRLDRNMSQAELADRAGIARRTITTVENGEGCTLNTLIRLLTALDHRELLEPLVRELPISPMKMIRYGYLNEKQRKYASKPRKQAEPTEWVWGDEK